MPLNGTAAGWTSYNIDGAGGWRNTDTSFEFTYATFFGFFRFPVFRTVSTPRDPSYWLNSNGDPGSDPSIQQTLTGLNVGATYEVTGRFRNIYSAYGSDSTSAPTSFAVLVDGAVRFEARKNQAPAGGAFVSFTASFTAVSDHATLALAGERNGQDASYEVDSVVVRSKNTRSFLTDFKSASAVDLWIDAAGRKTDVFPGVSRPSLVPVNVTTLHDFVRVYDQIQPGSGGNDVFNVYNTGDSTSVAVTLDTYRVPQANLDARGVPILHGATDPRDRKSVV